MEKQGILFNFLNRNRNPKSNNTIHPLLILLKSQNLCLFQPDFTLLNLLLLFLTALHYVTRYPSQTSPQKKLCFRILKNQEKKERKVGGKEGWI